MTFSIKAVTIAAGLSLAAGAAVGGSDAGPFANQIKARQAIMTLQAFNLGLLGAMAKGEVDYDSGAAQAAAANLAAVTTLNQSAMWPQGSDDGAHAGTRAKPEIWASFPDVSAKGKALADAAAALSAVAGNDLDALRGGIGPVGAACGACHKAYRAEAN